MDILLIHPPAAKAAEPPLGTAVLTGHLRGRGLVVDAVDANLEAFHYLLRPENLDSAAGTDPETSLKRALRNVPGSLAFLRSTGAEGTFARYSTAVNHLNRALGAYRGSGGTERLTLGDYVHGGLSEFDPADLERLSTGGEGTIFDDYFRDRLLPEVARLRPRLISLSVNYRHQVLPAFALAGLIRRRFPGIPVVGGGGMFSSWKTPMLERNQRFSAFSHIVFGPGEEALFRLARGGEEERYLVESPGRVEFVPEYDFARPLTDYLSPRPTLQVSASRGCYWHDCLFCPEATAPTHPFACHPPRDFPDLLLGLSRRYGVSHFHLTDNAVPVPVLRAMAVRWADLKGLSWHGFVRFEKALCDRPLVDDLAASGCRMLQLGLESGSQQVLDRLRKGNDLATASAILGNLKEAGILTYVYILLGTPGERESDALETLEFLEEHAGSISFLNLAVMNLPRESGLLDSPESGILFSAPLSGETPLGLYRSFEPSSGWGRAEAKRFLKRRLLATPAIREIVRRTPPLFTSNHAWYFPPSTPTSGV